MFPTKARNEYKATLERNGQVIWNHSFFNEVMIAGFDDLLNVYFKGQAPNQDWYVGLKKAGPIALSDTLNAHPGWDEFADYVGDRKPILFLDVANGSLTSDKKTSQFVINARGTITGIFVTNAQAGISAGGLMYGAAEFGMDRAVDINDILTIQTTMSFTN